ncbi:MAG: ABC transporter permease [Candidatus Aminicenantes bacterium]|nr:ABC transporter permease [Candidatus Aminicenantes bacterium]
MFKNYWKTAVRNIARYKGYSFINIISLSVAMAFCILIFLYIKHEYSYDKFHKNGREIYQVYAGSESMIIDVSENLGPALARQYPEIKTMITYGFAEAEVKVGSNRFKERVYAANIPFFDTFTFPLEQGHDPFSPKNPDVMVISSKTAEKYFGKESPIGGVISVNFGDQYHDFIISGVTRSIPDNSSIHFDMIIPTREAMFADEEKEGSGWQIFEFGTFIRLSSKVKIADLEKKSNLFLEEHLGEVFQKANLDPKEFKLFFIPLEDLHMKSESTSGGLAPTGNPLHSLLLTGIGLLVLLISCFNFINLTIARSSHRFKEIGVRKVAGAGRFSLIKQFMFESLAVSGFALIISILIVEILRPLFNNLAGKNLTLEQNLYNIPTLLFLLVMVLVIGTLSGLYPALLTSRVDLVNVIKRKHRIAGKKHFSRFVVVFQFALSLFLIIESTIIYKQKNYLITKDLGFEQKNILAIHTKTGKNNGNDGETLLHLFKDKLAGHPYIKALTGSSGILDKNLSAFIRKKDGTPVITITQRIDYDYLDTLGIQLAAGRNFSKGSNSETSNAVLVNETFVKTFEIENPIGKPVTGMEHGKLKDPIIIGVVKDFNYISLRENIYPMILHLDKKNDIGFIVVKMDPTGIPKTLNDLKALWTQFRPEKTFEYFFLDDDIKLHYRMEERWNQIMGTSSFFAVLIAALGLFGLTGISIARRFKEIGIRRVMGATSLEIVKMINREFLLLVGTANLIIWPISYYISSKWLENFAYRTTLTPLEFIFGGAIVLGVAALTISSQAIRASFLNPAVVLRDE